MQTEYKYNFLKVEEWRESMSGKGDSAVHEVGPEEIWMHMYRCHGRGAIVQTHD